MDFQTCFTLQKGEKFVGGLTFVRYVTEQGEQPSFNPAKRDGQGGVLVIVKDANGKEKEVSTLDLERLTENVTAHTPYVPAPGSNVVSINNANR